MNEHPDTTQRDEQVGRLLDTVELDHGPAYWDTVRSATGPHLAKLRRRPLWARRPVQVGVAVAIGVLLDTFIVRALLVPAIATLVGRWNWWPSKLGRRPTDVPSAKQGWTPQPLSEED